MTAREILYDPAGRLRAGWRLAAYFLVLAVSMQVAAALVGPAVAALGRAVGARFDTSPVAFTAALLGAHWLMLRVDRLPWQAVRMGRDGARGAAWIEGLAAGALAMGLPAGLLLLVGLLRVESTPDGSWWGTALALSLFLAPAALWEELVFRGYLFTVLEDLGGRWTALAVTSLLFGLAHLTNQGATARSTALVATAGVFLGLVMLATRSLYAAWAAHWAFNWMQAVALHAAVSGSGFATPDYRTVDAGPDWLTGGAWGPEGGLGAIVGMGAALVVLSALRPRPSAAMRQPGAEGRGPRAAHNEG